MRALIASVLGLLGLLLLAGCDNQPERPRRQQTLKLLPDTPPPPPPPPKPEDKPPPKAEDKPQPRELPKPAEVPPQAQALKSDEAAGDGAGNGMTAGAVTQDYGGQKIGSGTAIGGGDDGAANRLAANAFGNAATRALNEFLVRDKSVKLRDYRVRVQLWLSASGGLQRAELVDSTGDTDTDQALRAALSRFPGTAIAPPAKLPQPMRVLVSNRMMG